MNLSNTEVSFDKSMLNKSMETVKSPVNIKKNTKDEEN